MKTGEAKILRVDEATSVAYGIVKRDDDDWFGGRLIGMPHPTPDTACGTCYNTRREAVAGAMREFERATGAAR